jgi:acyl-CoA reductase-like NAD-dependent aldehyde dehydrogenase
MLKDFVSKNLIDGEWIESQGSKTFKNINPADESDIVGEFQDSSKSDINYAVTSARLAFKGWAMTPAAKRAEIIFEIGQELIKEKEEYAQLMTREMGKVLAETRGDVQEAIDMAFYAAGEGRRMFGETVPSESKYKWAMSKRVPVGVVGCITPWNFPLAIPSWKIFPALIAGNTVVIKPAEDTPGTVIKFVELCNRFLPRGVLNVVTGYGEAGEHLVKHPLVDFVSFTGSTATGTKVAMNCAELGKPYSLEMGGKNVIIVMDDADLELACEGVVWGAFGTSGQRCTATSRVLVHKDVHDKFVDMLVAKTSTLKVGNGLEADTDVGPVINEKQRNKIISYIMANEAKLVCGGISDNNFIHPTIFTNCHKDMKMMREEIFGPVLGVIEIEDFEDAVSTANYCNYGLSAAIFTKDVNQSFHFMEQIETGICYVNASTIGAEIQLPFGGVKGTGNGHREAGRTMLDNVTEWKSIYVDYSGKLQKAQIDH